MDELEQLNAHDVDKSAADRIRARAHEELARAARPNVTLSAFRRTYRVIEPVLVSALAASYLVWAFRVVWS